jgi:hypothetical protein
MWTGPNVPGGTTNDMYLQNININQKGTFYSTATNDVRSKTSSNVAVDVQCKLLLSLVLLSSCIFILYLLQRL